jgi:hypothetical protein
MAAIPTGLPEDWALDRDLACPRCRYNLRMLHQPRCPECGLSFRWQELLRVECPRCGGSLCAVDGANCPRCDLALDWARLLSRAPAAGRDLFEVSDRPVRAAVRTCFAALNPWTFWFSIPLELPPAERRLRRFRRWARGIALLGLLLPIAAGLVYPNLGGWALIAALIFGFPVLTSWMLPMFTPTLAKFGIRRDQLLRVWALGSVGMVWAGALLIVETITCVILNLSILGVRPIPLLSKTRLGTWVWTGGFGFVGQGGLEFHVLSIADEYPLPVQAAVLNLLTVLYVFLLGTVWFCVFLWVALRHYLRLSAYSSAALLFSTQIIAALILMILLTAMFPITLDGRWLLVRS